MYGETSRLRTQAASTRENATQLRSRASGRLTQVETMAWASSAGDALRSRIRAVVLKLGGEAQLLDDAAAQLEAHATAVEKVKAAIEAVRIAVEDAWNRAANVAGNVIETTKDMAVSAEGRIRRTGRR
jgi:hypothetical protein